MNHITNFLICAGVIYSVMFFYRRYTESIGKSLDKESNSLWNSICSAMYIWTLGTMICCFWNSNSVVEYLFYWIEYGVLLPIGFVMVFSLFVNLFFYIKEHLCDK